MTKNDRMEAIVSGLPSHHGFDPCYEGYFALFNTGEYYKAHDILEHLWLQGAGDDYAFYKGLIQFAGGFVHLQLQQQQPGHHKHGRRLRPAARLFALAAANLEQYAPAHHGLDVTDVCRRSKELIAQLTASQFSENPWHPQHLPKLRISAATTPGSEDPPRA